MGNYLTAGGDYDVFGKNWAGSRKWTLSQGDASAARHAARTQRRSVEIVRRNRVVNPRLAGIMPFGSPFHYCGDRVRSFADVEHHPSPMLEAASDSFSPVLLSIESWSRHAYCSSNVEARIHVVNDDDHGLDLAPSTVEWKLTCDDDCTPDEAPFRGTLRIPAVGYYEVYSSVISVLPPGGCALPTGCDWTACSLSASLHGVRATTFRSLLLGGHATVARLLVARCHCAETGRSVPTVIGRSAPCRGEERHARS